MLSFYFSFQGGWANRHATGRHPYPKPFGNYFKGPCRTSVGLECLHGVVVGTSGTGTYHLIMMMSQPMCDSPTLWGSVFFFSGLWDAA